MISENIQKKVSTVLLSSGNSWQENLRDTFENWQSEFLQLIWQVAESAFEYHLRLPDGAKTLCRLKHGLVVVVAVVLLQYCLGLTLA